ncbi:aminopeptidase [Solibacillus sp. R5-41]|uniref:M20/M25/M40 family metallo-hydrolase n=1 Tax=Solibacillus sp. R5-41 TaxID=2048654 RepID=UPI000C129366|nr:M20/M25/M40 family metallo-hydrolase [Solibacillus sp. R5-41]ATP39003.1 aminopeptidase [Solibacillus sp. R5-41]
MPDKKMGELITENGDEVLFSVSANSSTTENGELTGLLFDAGLGLTDNFNDESKGKIALIKNGGELNFQQKVDNAVAAGVAGVIIYNNIDHPRPLGFSVSVNTSIPVGGITKSSGEALLNDIVAENKTVTLSVEQLQNLTSSNIIATKLPEKGGSDEIVHVSAHFDSVPFSPGANDNGSGTAAALELARVFKDYKIDKELRFVFVGAEEIGLIGSKYYVGQLSQEEINRSIANYNMDMVATAWDNATTLYTNTVDGNPNLVTETANNVAKLIDTPSELFLFKRGASDHVDFHNVGIPAANFIWREPVTNNLEPYYHTPDDVLKYVSAERLREVANIVGGSVYTLIREK